jgi:hypothetical protein
MPKRIYELPNSTLIDLGKVCSITNITYRDGPELFGFGIRFVNSRNTMFYTDGIIVKHDTHDESENERNNIREAWEAYLGAEG